MDELIAELLAERFGRGVPWRERTQRPTPAPGEVPEPDNDLTYARRRRVLNDALDDVPQTFRRWQRTA